MTMILKHWKSIKVESERLDKMLTEVNGNKLWTLLCLQSNTHFRGNKILHKGLVACYLLFT